MKNLQKFPPVFSLPDRKLKIKFGIDPTSDKLHLGHLIPLMVVKEFQDQGHQIDIVIGNLTAQMGDPSGKNTMRPILSSVDTNKNAESIITQVKRILGDDINIHLNNNWFEKMTMIDMLSILSKFKVGNLLSRDSFQKRMQDSNTIGMHELIVPILQGLDSVNLESDIEIGGSDQLFNFKISRELQEMVGQDPENCLMVPIINGTDGRKMSKSFNNCIFINDDPKDIFGKVMSISDDTMDEWCEVFLNDCLIEHPFHRKNLLAHRITSLICGVDIADKAKSHFESVIQNKSVPTDMIEIDDRSIIDIIRKVRKSSISESRRLILSNSVKLNGLVVKDDKVEISPGDIIKIGKRDFARII